VAAGDVHREGITEVTAADIRAAAEMDAVVKLLAICERVESEGAEAVSVRVHPAMIPRSHPLASVREAFNAVFVEADAAGELMFYGRGAGGDPTASAVLGDVVAAARHKVAGGRGPGESAYADLFERIWGKGSLDCEGNADAAYDRIGKSVAAYERSKEANPFSSKYDSWLGKKAKLSDQELRGLALFEGKGKCSKCHPSRRGPKGKPRSSPTSRMTTSASRKTRRTPSTGCLRNGTRKGRPSWIRVSAAT
jgi:hypothetical protein